MTSQIEIPVVEVGTKKKRDALLDFSQRTILDPLFEEGDLSYKKMFGGLAVYYDGKMVICLMEDENTFSYKDKKFSWPIWNGVLFPTDRAHHPSLQNQFSELVPHPVLGKWLYLPIDAKSYEEHALSLVNLIMKHDPRLGITPGQKKRSKSKRKSK